MKRTAIALAAWTIAALLFAGQLVIDSAYSAHRLRATEALALALTGWYAWALLSPLVIWIARRVRSVVVHALIAVAATFVKIALTTEALRAFGVPPRSISLLVNIPLNVAAYFAIVGVTWFVDARLRASRLEASLAEARLELLRNQIHPHFLFNTLHAISELMHEDVDAADRMVTRLAELLRASLETSGRQEIPLRDELAMLDRYLDIERVRLGERLRYNADVDPRALDQLVPNFLLQPLVENAIRHAIAIRREGGTIALRARVEDDALHIEIEDDGPGFTESAEGIGLSNVRARLKQMYANASLEIESERGTRIRIVIRQ